MFIKCKNSCFFTNEGESFIKCKVNGKRCPYQVFCQKRKTFILTSKAEKCTNREKSIMDRSKPLFKKVSTNDNKIEDKNFKKKIVKNENELNDKVLTKQNKEK